MSSKNNGEEQFNVKLPSKLILAIKKYVLKSEEERAKKIKQSDVALQAFFYWLGPFGELGMDQALWKARIDKAKLEIEKEIGGKDIVVQLSSEDLAEIFRQIRDAIEGAQT